MVAAHTHPEADHSDQVADKQQILFSLVIQVEVKNLLRSGKHKKTACIYIRQNKACCFDSWKNILPLAGATVQQKSTAILVHDEPIRGACVPVPVLPAMFRLLVGCPDQMRMKQSLSV